MFLVLISCLQCNGGLYIIAVLIAMSESDLPMCVCWLVCEGWTQVSSI